MKLKKKEKRELFKRVSKYLEDVSKLVIAGVVLSSITEEDIDTRVLIGLGLLGGIILVFGSYRAFILSNK